LEKAVTAIKEMLLLLFLIMQGINAEPLTFLKPRSISEVSVKYHCQSLAVLPKFGCIAKVYE